MKTILKLCYVCMIILTNYCFSQNIGDYKSIGTGNWTNAAIWQVYNGTSWVSATQYPGQTSGTYTVTVSSGNNVTVNTAATYNFGNIIVIGQLTLNASLTLATTKKLDVQGGTVLWNANNTNLTLSTNAIISVSGYTGSNGLQGGSCTNNRALYIGTQKYAACAGGGNVDFIFNDINNAGGSITSIPSANPLQICQGSSTVLSGAYSGNIGSSPTFSWSGSGPGGYAFSSTSQNPGSQTLNNPGIYTYNLIVTTVKNGNTYSNQNSITVTVDANSVAGTAIGNPLTICNNATSTLTLSGYTGKIQWQQSADGSTNWANVTTGTGATTASYTTGNLSATSYYRALVTNNTCTTVISNTIQVTVDQPSISGLFSTQTGTTSQLTGSGTPATVNPWSSSDSSIATVSNTGLVTGISVGSVTITYVNNNGCSKSISFVVTPPVCYGSPTAGSGIQTKVGITSLGRAGTDTSEWPAIRKGAYMVLESKTKGFVITRLSSSQISQIPSNQLVEGMMVYNTTSDCISIYDGTNWQCYNTQTCP